MAQLVKIERSLFFHGDTTYPESAVLQTALWSQDSGRVYPGLDQWPYTPAPYGPLFYMSLEALAKATHAGFDHLMILARVAVAACFLLLAFLALRWQRGLDIPLAAASVAPALLLSQVDFADWNVSVRPDLPALFLSFAAFYVLSRRSLTARRAALAGVLCALAGLFKQSFIALPLAAGLWLFLSRRFRHGFIFLGCTAVVGFSILGWLGWRREPFLQEMLLARYSPISAVSAVEMVKADFIRYPAQITMLGLGLLGLILMPVASPMPGGPDRRLRLLCGLYFFLSWATGFYTAMAPGANMNAFLEAWTITATLAPVAVMTLAENWTGLAFPAQAMILLLWIGGMAVSLDLWRILAEVRGPASDRLLAEAFRGHRILSDLPYVSAHSEHPELLDPSVNHYLEMAGHWSPQPLLDELRENQFDYVVVGLNGGHVREWRGLTLFSDSILREIRANYRPVCAAGRFAVLAPRRRAVDNAWPQEAMKQAGCGPVTDSANF